MKSDPTSWRFPSSPEEIAAAINRSPTQVTDPECAYDPNDAAAVEAFWQNSAVRRPGQRGPAGVDARGASGEGGDTEVGAVTAKIREE